MSPLEEMRARQRDDLVFQSDAAFAAFLREVSTTRANRDRLPITDIELRHLARTRRTA